jgi:hypothetical protein
VRENIEKDFVKLGCVDVEWNILPQESVQGRKHLAAVCSITEVAVSTVFPYKFVTEYGNMFTYEEVLWIKSFLWTDFAVLS